MPTMPSPNARQHQPRIGQSIRTRLLALLLGLTTISVLTVGYLGVNSVQSVGESARQVSAEALRAQAEEYLRQVTISEAQRNDLILERVRHDAENVAQYAAGIFDRPDAFPSGAYWQAEDRMFIGPDGQYKNDKTDVSSAFAPNFVAIDEEVLTALELGAYLDFVFAPTYESDPNTVAIYLGTEQETVRYYPNIDLGALVPPDFQVTQRPWYLNAVPENNPERAVIWSPIYVDATGKGLMVTAAAPVYTGRDEFIGVVGIDVTLEDITASVEEARLLGSGYSFLIDDTGHAIALPEQGYQDILGRPPEPDELGADLSEATTPSAPILIPKMIAGATGFDTLEVGGRELFVAYAPLESTGWSLANVIDAETVLQAMSTLQEELETSARSLMLARILPVGGGILAVVTIIGLLLTNRLTDPIRRLATAAQQIGAGHWDAPLPRAGNDEIGVLSQAFATMTVQLRDLLEGLEQQVTARTRDLERRSIQLEASAQVAREAAAIHDVGQLLDATVRLISERFGFYHAGIFLLDQPNEYAVLQAVSSEGGQRMLARGHQLKAGEVGIVGYVAGSGHPRVALDVGEDAVFFDNPDLPLTRSELALPLKVRGRLIGVLDVQSTEAAAFTDEDVAILQTMADQIALAIENARLLEEAEERLREVDTLLGRYGRESWERLATERPRWGYIYDGVDVLPREMTRAIEIEVEPQLTVPLQVRGTAIGHLDLVLADQPLTPDTAALAQAVAEQASLALENARLFQETQRALGEMEALHLAVQAVSAELDLDVLTQKLIDEASRLIGADYGVLVALDPATGGMRHFKTYGIEEGRCPLTRLPQGKGLLKLLLEGQTVRADNVREHPSYGDTLPLGHLPIVSFLGLPLLYQNQIRGFLAVSNRGTGRTFDQADENLLGTFAAQATATLENARLFQETQRSAEAMRHLYDLSSTLMGVESSRQAMALIAGTARQLTHAAIANVHAYNEARGGYERVSVAADADQWDQEVEGEIVSPRPGGLTAHIIQEGAPVSIPDTATDERAHPDLAAMGLRSMLGVPIQMPGQKPIGVLFCHGKPVDQFDDEDLRLITMLANRTAASLQGIRLAEEVRTALEETTALYRAGRAIGAATSVEEVGQALVDYAATSGVDVARILLFEHDEQGRPTYIVLCEGWTVDDRPAQPHGTRLSMEDYPLADLLNPNEPVIVEDVLTDPRANEMTRTLIATISGLRSFAMVPITSGERWIGMVFVGRNEPSTFAEELIRGHWTLAGQAAVALESMRLLETTQRRAEHERLIGEVTGRMRASLDLESVLRTAADEMYQALGLDEIVIRLATEDGGDGAALGKGNEKENQSPAAGGLGMRTPREEVV